MAAEKKRRGRLTACIKYILVIIPFIIGCIGYGRLEGVSLSWAAYYAIRLYGLNTDISEINLLIEIARWTAPVATASVVLLVLQSILTACQNRLRSLSKKSCSVYGDSPEARFFLKSLGKYGVQGNENKLLRTPYHVVFGGDNQMPLRFYEKNKDFFRDKYRLYLNLKNISPMAIQQENITSFSNEWNCAVLYWRENPARTKERIALIGDGTLCDALLEQSLLVNILDTKQAVEYHVWNEGSSFEELHTKLPEVLSMTEDKIQFYDDSWTGQTGVFSSFDRVILCIDEAQNMQVAAKLIAYVPRVKLHVYMQSGSTLSFFEDNERIRCFGRMGELLTRDIILQEKLLETARETHENYRRKAAAKGEKPVPTWEELSPFKRQSNIAATNYYPVMRRLKEEGKTINEIAELEHIRWCRFHYLHNWTAGSVRDDSRFVHTDMIPFSELSEKKKQLDCDNVELALKSEVH